MSIRTRYIAAILVSVHAAPPIVAQQRLGEEFLVNSYTLGWQLNPAVATAPDGRFVVVWEGPWGPGPEIYGQRYDGSGRPIGGQFRVNAHTLSAQWDPAVAMDANGDFVVVWHSRFQDGSSYGIFAQRYDASGERVGGEFLVNSYTTGDQSFPAVAADPAGNFVVVWDGGYFLPNEVSARRYDAFGNPIGTEFQVNTYTPAVDYRSSVAMDGDGDFVVVWDRWRSTSANWYGVIGRRYDAVGNPLGGEFQIPTVTTVRGGSRHPEVASDAEGNFVVVWHHGESAARYDIYARRFDADGNALGAEFVVNASTTGSQKYPGVAVESGGDFVVVWESGPGWPESYEVVGRRFDSAGTPVGDDFVVNTQTAPLRTRKPDIAFGDHSDFVIAWMRGIPWVGGVPPAGSPVNFNWDVLGQRFAGPGLHLAADGDCPGRVDVTLVQAPPGSEVAVIAAANNNGFTKGGSICSGTELEIGEPFQLPPTFVIVDGSGNGEATLELGAGRCFLQALALADCSASNTVEVP
jgi:hypothetical protein